MRAVFLVSVLVLSPLTGCMQEVILDVTDDGCEPVDAGRESDGVLRILTYDIVAFSEEMLEEFTNQSGYDIEMIRTDDAGGILEQMLQTQQAPQADIAVGLDNTYLATALDRCVLQSHNVSRSGLSDEALEPYQGIRGSVRPS